MEHEIDLKNYNYRTDLISDLVNNTSASGIEKESITINKIVIEKTKIKDNNSLKKKVGNYVTINFEDITDSNNLTEVLEVFTKEITNYLEIKKLLGKNCLVIGLGNIKSTPDSLGPKVLEKIVVTKHLFDLNLTSSEYGFSNVACFSPSVTGVTGIETKKIILSLVSSVKPDYVIIIDSLAARSVNRLNKVIQIADSGIAPGSGIGNNRDEISFTTLGIPVIAIGVPTVVDASTIVFDTINWLYQKISFNKDNKSNRFKFALPNDIDYRKYAKELNVDDKNKILGLLGSLNDEEVKQLISEVLTPIGYNLMVTPKEVDFVINKLSEVIGSGLNQALHRQIKN